MRYSIVLPKMSQQNENSWVELDSCEAFHQAIEVCLTQQKIEETDTIYILDNQTKDRFDIMEQGDRVFVR